MHISEGVLSAQVLAAGAAFAVAGLGIGLKKIPQDRLTSVAILSAAFFVASLIHVPVGPSSVHLIMNGLIGLLLGWAAFPAIFVGLFLQALLFQYGGLTVLGLNTVNMALPAVLCGAVFRPFLFRGKVARSVASFAAGALSIFGAAVLTALSLFFTNEGFLTAAELLLVAHIPVVIIEGVLTMLTVAFILRVEPDFFLAYCKKEHTA